MENLAFGQCGDLVVYDLKGSMANRWNKKREGTLLDTNYRIDMNGEPLPIIKHYYRKNLNSSFHRVYPSCFYLGLRISRTMQCC